MAGCERRLNRRDILKGIGWGIAGVTLGEKTFGFAGNIAGSGKSAAGKQPKKQLYKKVTKPARVSLIKGNDRQRIVYQSLKMLEDEVIASIGDKQILIKPNMVVTNNPLCATHADAVRAILEFLKPHYKKQIIIGESVVWTNTFDGYKNYGYLPLEREYNVKLVDLNRDSFQYRYVLGADNRPLPVRIISTFLDPNVYVISAARMKTHDRVLVTLSLKNVLLGCPMNDYKNNDKPLLHPGPRAVNSICHYNMFRLAQEVYPDLAVIDGFVGMEGNGPIRGTPFDSRVAIASLDALAADTVATRVMGFDPQRILYLSAMAEAGMGQADIEKINILGTPLNQCLYHFRPEEQMRQIYNLNLQAVNFNNPDSYDFYSRFV